MSKFEIPPELLKSINDTASNLVKAAEKFTADPLIPGKYSRTTSIVSSAQKRHGKIMEQAILARLKQNPNLEVWTESEFHVSSSAEVFIASALKNSKIAKVTDIAYQSKDDSVRSMQVDLISYNKSEKSLISYEIKRGNGLHDSKTQAAMKKNLFCQQTLLKSYGEFKGYKVAKVDSKVIFYYGKCSLPEEHSLTKLDLDSHFDFPLVEFVEEVTDIYRQKVIKIVEGLVDPEKADLRTQIGSILTEQLEKKDKEVTDHQTGWIRKIFS